jgi:putative transposase
MKYHKARHSTYLLHVHIVLVTKYRRKILGDLHRARFADIARSVCTDFSASLIEVNGECDHMHLLVDYPPSIQFY